MIQKLELQVNFPGKEGKMKAMGSIKKGETSDGIGQTDIPF